MLEIMNELGTAPGSGARNGFGLKSVAERVRLLNGRFSFKSAGPAGTRLVVWVPTHG